MQRRSVRRAGRAVEWGGVVLRSWRFSEGDQPRSTSNRPALGDRLFVAAHRIRHMFSRNDSFHCGSGKKYNSASGLR